MRILVRYNDCADQALHSTIGIVALGVIRNPTAKDILKRFVKSYNKNVMKGYGCELNPNEMHIAIKNGDDDYVALPSDLLFSQSLVENEDGYGSKSLLYARHGKARTQGEFLLKMKDQIRYAIQAEMGFTTASAAPAADSGTITSEPTVPSSSSKIPNVGVEQRDEKLNDDPEALITAIETITLTTFDETKVADQSEIIQMAQDAKDPEALITTIDTITSNTFDETEVPDQSEILETVQDTDDKLGTPPDASQLTPQTTWIQFKKVMHSFGVDTVVYKDVLDEIKKEKAMQVGKYVYVNGREVPDDDPVLDISVKNQLGSEFTKNFIELRKKAINRAEEEDDIVLANDIDFEVPAAEQKVTESKAAAQQTSSSPTSIFDIDSWIDGCFDPRLCTLAAE